MNFQSMLNELEKIAITRSVKEWRAAQAAGNTGAANQIAQGAGQLGLAPRYLENISGGGMEAAVDKMMGQSRMGGGANQSGYVARKIYKPDSPIATGEHMTGLLAQKKEMTDAARGISPQAKQMVPEMFGHQQIQGPAGQVRHLSEHEYVPGMQRLRSSPDAVAHAQSVQDTVAAPMAARGTPMLDIARPHVEGRGGIGGNAANVGLTPQGPKVIDFLPHDFAGGKGGAFQNGPNDIATSYVGSGRGDTGYGLVNREGQLRADQLPVSQLRRDVYRPQADYKHPALRPVAPARPAAGSLPSEGATVVERKMPNAAASEAATSVVGRRAPALPAPPAATSPNMLGGAAGKAPAAGLGSLKHTLLMSPAAHAEASQLGRALPKAPTPTIMPKKLPGAAAAMGALGKAPVSGMLGSGTKVLGRL